MDKEFVYKIEGAPIPLARPRFYNGKVYDSQKAEKERVRWQIIAQGRPHEKYTGSIELRVTFFFQSKHSELYTQPHTTTPDLSNLIKFLEDACTTVLFDDDCIISSIYARKVYDAVARTEFTVVRV